MPNASTLKRDAARAALGHVEHGMRLGIGTGSTAEEFVRVLAEAVQGGLKVTGVSTSERTEALCRSLGVPTATLDELPELDLTIDGADEIDPALNLIKGGGGALLREKIVAAASARMLVIADGGKLVDVLGAFALPIEVNRFGLSATRIAIAKTAARLGLSGSLHLRGGEAPFVTDGGHFILDASFGRIPDPERTHAAFCGVPGVVETGLFTGICTGALVASEAGVTLLTA
jgi:ribose 5-phosphate isomerase A